MLLYHANNTNHFTHKTKTNLNSGMPSENKCRAKSTLLPENLNLNFKFTFQTKRITR